MRSKIAKQGVDKLPVAVRKLREWWTRLFKEQDTRRTDEARFQQLEMKLEFWLEKVRKLFTNQDLPESIQLQGRHFTFVLASSFSDLHPTLPFNHIASIRLVQAYLKLRTYVESPSMPTGDRFVGRGIFREISSVLSELVR